MSVFVWVKKEILS